MVVVTGASGNLGTCLVERLVADPRVAEVRAVARRPPADDDRPGVRWTAADVAADDLDPVVAGADVVVHLAWKIQPSWDVEELRRTNVDGSAAVFAAVRRAGVPALVHASSVGAYAPGPKDRGVDESWPLGGHPDHPYSVHKAEVEGLLDVLEQQAPELRVVRMRPALLLGRHAGRELRRYFLPRVVRPRSVLRPGLVRRAPTRFQVVRTDDAAAAFALAALGGARGPFNVSTDDVLGGRHVPVLQRVARPLAAVTWRAHLQPVDPGWVTLLFRSPLLDAGRARRELGWEPRCTGHDGLADGLAGIRHTEDAPTPALRG